MDFELQNNSIIKTTKTIFFNKSMSIWRKIMTPLLKAHSLSFSLATTIVYILWKNLETLQTECWIINIIITFILSLSFYRIIYKSIFFSCKRIKTIKKWILGSYYFEGLWIGYYTVDDEVEYYYEIFEQELNSLTIKGKSFDKNKKFTGEWAIINPNLNIADSKFTYYYEMDVASSHDITLGYSRATIYWDSKGRAKKLIGFAIDNYSLNKQLYTSIKVNKLSTYEKWIEDNFWHEAENLYKSNVYRS